MNVTNVITVNADDVAEFLGAASQKFAYRQNRSVITNLVEAAKRCANRFFVLEGTATVAGQSTQQGAMRYMNADRVLVICELPPPACLHCGAACVIVDGVWHHNPQDPQRACGDPYKTNARPRPDGLTISDACVLLRELQSRGMIAELGGAMEASKRYRADDGGWIYDDAWFHFRGRIVNAHGFGIVSAVFDLLDDMPLADSYASSGKREEKAA